MKPGTVSNEPTAGRYPTVQWTSPPVD